MGRLSSGLRQDVTVQLVSANRASARRPTARSDASACGRRVRPSVGMLGAQAARRRDRPAPAPRRTPATTGTAPRGGRATVASRPRVAARPLQTRRRRSHRGAILSEADQHVNIGVSRSSPRALDPYKTANATVGSVRGASVSCVSITQLFTQIGALAADQAALSSTTYGPVFGAQQRCDRNQLAAHRRDDGAATDLHTQFV
jgi:hypothetical protein